MKIRLKVMIDGVSDEPAPTKSVEERIAELKAVPHG